MADISKILLPNGSVFNIKDSRIPSLPGSENVYLRGDGQFAAPTVAVSTSTTSIIDGGDCLIISSAESANGVSF